MSAWELVWYEIALRIAVVVVYIPTAIVFFAYWAVRFVWDRLDKQQDRWMDGMRRRKSATQT